MKSHTKHWTLNVPTRMGFVNITREVEQVVQESGVAEGLVLVNTTPRSDAQVRGR